MNGGARSHVQEQTAVEPALPMQLFHASIIAQLAEPSHASAADDWHACIEVGEGHAHLYETREERSTEASATYPCKGAKEGYVCNGCLAEPAGQEVAPQDDAVGIRYMVEHQHRPHPSRLLDVFITCSAHREHSGHHANITIK